MLKIQLCHHRNKLLFKIVIICHTITVLLYFYQINACSLDYYKTEIQDFFQKLKKKISAQQLKHASLKYMRVNNFEVITSIKLHTLNCFLYANIIIVC